MVTISLQPDDRDSWSVSRHNICLFSDLQLGQAIRLARELAREEHARSGRAVSVDMPGETSVVILARYAGGKSLIEETAAA